MEYIDYRILECLLITNDSIVTEANISLSNFINDNKDYFCNDYEAFTRYASSCKYDY